MFIDGSSWVPVISAVLEVTSELGTIFHLVLVQDLQSLILQEGIVKLLLYSAGAQCC